MSRKANRNKMNSNYSSVLKGIGTSMLLTLLGAAVISTMIITGDLQEMQIGYAAMGTLMISAIAGAIVSGKGIQQGRVVTVICAGFGYFLSLALLNMVLFRGDYTGIGATMLIILGSSLAGLCITSGRKRKYPGKKRARMHG